MPIPSTGSDLPFPQTPSASIAGRTLAESEHHWRQDPKRLKDDAPNIVIFMNDDAGFSNSDAFGGPVHTPTMSRLAERGVTYNRFHTTAMCSPTRAALLTGRNHHRVGYGQIAEFAADFDGYIGEIPRSAATIGQVLSSYGYDTGAFGKWHNTPITALTPTGPYDQYPTGLGFRYFYGFIAGESSQYEPRLFENTNPIEPPKTVEEGYHLTEDLADHAISFIRNNRAVTPERPLFIYFAPGAVHGPHQVSSEWADKYAGKFDEGWEALRVETFRRQKEMGWIPDNAELTPIDDRMQRWDEIPEDQRAFQTRLMEVYAGYLEHTDAQYGKIVDERESQGLLDNPLIFYLGSDNGASAEGMEGSVSELVAQNGVATTVADHIEVMNRDYGGIENLGGPMMESMYHHGWAWAGDTPFKSTKLVAAHFGGTRTPLVVSWPAGIKADAEPRAQFHHVIDVAATIYDVLDIDPPRPFNGTEQVALDGVSMVPSFTDVNADDSSLAQYFEIMGSRGVYHDGWFAGTFGPRVPWINDPAALANWNPDTDPWELYDLRNDYSQANDLADEMPEKLAVMREIYTMHAMDNKVFPTGGGLYTVFYHPEEMRSSALTEWTFFEGQGRIPESLAPKFVSGFSTLATIDADVPEGADGVLYCVGGLSGGFTVYMDKGVLRAEYNMLGMERYKIASDALIPTGHVQIGVEVKFDKKEREAPATVTLTVDGVEVGTGRIKRSVPAIFTAAETFDIGKDLGSPVALDYYGRSPFSFTGTIERIHIAYI
jgi:arylsulfatase